MPGHWHTEEWERRAYAQSFIMLHNLLQETNVIFSPILVQNSSLHNSISLLLLRMPRSKRCGTNNSPLFQFCALISEEAQPDDRHRAKMSLPFVVAVLASCSYIIAADQKSGEVMFTCCQTEHSNLLIIALPIAHVTQQWHRWRWESLICSMLVSSIPYPASKETEVCWKFT